MGTAMPNTHYGDTLPDRMRRRMKRLDLNQAQLAERTGISPVMIHKLITGKSETTKHILDLARALECDPEWLTGKYYPEKQLGIDFEGNADSEKTAEQIFDALNAVLPRLSEKARSDLKQRIALRLVEG